MLDFLRANQIQFLWGSGFASLLLAVFTLIMRFQSIRKKNALFQLEIGIALLLIADAFSYRYRGDTSELGFYMTRISNFLVYIMTCANIFFFNGYITSLFMGRGKFLKLPRRLLCGFILPCIGMTIVVISQFTGIYYSFDAGNTYQRGPLYVMGFIVPFAVLMIQFSFIVQYSKLLKKGLFYALQVFIVLPMVAAVAQFYLYGLSLINLSTFIAGLSLFISALVDQNIELSKAADTDMMTGYPNTYGYLHAIEKKMITEDITKYAGIYFDIVNMNRINGKYGKDNGDDIIVMYADYIKRRIGKNEVLGRLGGNFFVALIEKENVNSFLNMLKDVPVSFKFEGKNETVHIAAVSGIYLINKPNIPAGLVIGNSATAVNYAKTVAHKPYVYLDEELEREIKSKRQTEEAARKGIEAQEFEVYYQPKVDTNDNTLYGCEALARWNHKGKVISPMEFVPVMEKTGSITDLDFYILEHVCQDIKGWLEAGMNPPCVSVNFSRKNLGNPILAEAISKVVEKYNVPKNLIQIEVTETIDEFPLSYLKGVVEALQRYGLSVAIDDYGMGSSSVNILNQVPFNTLKIDKSLVNYDNERGRVILETIINLAKSLGLQVVAEGVEDRDKVKELLELGCHFVQGFTFDKPLEKRLFEARIVNGRYR